VKSSRLPAILAALVLAAAAVAVAVVVNLVLLDRASSANDPVGKLRPTANLPAAPPSVVRPQTGPVRGGEADD
jgi:hypothetical protein